LSSFPFLSPLSVLTTTSWLPALRPCCHCCSADAAAEAAATIVCHCLACNTIIILFLPCLRCHCRIALALTVPMPLLFYPCLLLVLVSASALLPSHSLMQLMYSPCFAAPTPLWLQHQCHHFISLPCSCQQQQRCLHRRHMPTTSPAPLPYHLLTLQTQTPMPPALPPSIMLIVECWYNSVKQKCRGVVDLAL
jgi:hypothetical protein